MPGGENTNKSGLPFEDQVKDLVFNQEMVNGDDYMICDKKFEQNVKDKSLALTRSKQIEIKNYKRK